MTTIRQKVIFLVLAISALFGAWHIYNLYLPNENKPTPLSGFSLATTNGKLFDAKSLRGQWTILFFGYMSCPDICPQTLAKMREVWHSLPKGRQAPARFVFANINSNDNDLPKLKSFLVNYHPDFIGVSGNRAEIAQLGDQLGIFHQPNLNKIDHTASLIIIDPKGRLSAIIAPPFTSQDVIKQMQDLAIL